MPSEAILTAIDEAYRDQLRELCRVFIEAKAGGNDVYAVKRLKQGLKLLEDAKVELTKILETP